MELEEIRKKGIISLLTYVAVFYVGAYFVSTIILGIYKGLNITIEKDGFYYYQANALVNLSIYVILFIALLIINRGILKKEFIDFKKDPKKVLIQIVGGFGIFYVISYVASVLTQSIDTYSNIVGNLFGRHNAITTTADNQTYIETVLKSSNFFWMFISAAFFGPICEELVFRKSIFSICNSPELGILLSSLLFGAIHVTSSIGSYDALSLFLMFIPYVASGVGLSLVYIKSDYNIYVPIVVHMLSNILSMVLSVLI